MTHLPTSTPTSLPTSAPTRRPTTLPTSLDAPFAFEGHVIAYKRELQRELHRRPTDIQRALMTTAAIARARFDQASRDPAIKPANLAHLERVARRAMEAARASFPAKVSA